MEMCVLAWTEEAALVSENTGLFMLSRLERNENQKTTKISYLKETHMHTKAEGREGRTTNGRFQWGRMLKMKRCTTRWIKMKRKINERINESEREKKFGKGPKKRPRIGKPSKWNGWCSSSVCIYSMHSNTLLGIVCPLKQIFGSFKWPFLTFISFVSILHSIEFEKFHAYALADSSSLVHRRRASPIQHLTPNHHPLHFLCCCYCCCYVFVSTSLGCNTKDQNEEWTLKQKMIIVQKHRDKLFGLLWFLYHFRQVLTTHTRTPTPGHVCVWPCLLTFILSCCQFFFLFTTNTNSSISVCENSLVMYLRTNTHTCTHDITFYLAKDERNFTHFHGLRIGGIQHNGNIKFLNCKITVAFEVKVCVSVCVCWICCSHGVSH